jgi:putative hydrolase of the HAD superfamily
MTPKSTGLILNLDDTLYPERQFVRSGFRAVAAEVERRFNVPAPAALGTLLQALRAGGRSRALQVLCLHYDLPPTLVPDLVDVIRAHRPTLRMPVDSATLLARARAQGWRLGVLTNGLPEVQARKVQALGLAARVDTVVYAQEWGSGRGKPERDAFDVIRARLGTIPRLTVFVGDDPWCDMVGARTAGQHSILIRSEGGSPRASGADAIVTSLDGVLAAAAGLVCREVADAA